MKHNDGSGVAVASHIFKYPEWSEGAVVVTCDNAVHNNGEAAAQCARLASAYETVWRSEQVRAGEVCGLQSVAEICAC